MNLKLLACEILYRETCAAVAQSRNRVDIEFLPKGLHDMGQEGMNRRLQEELAAIDQSQYDAILFGYGLCSNGLVGLTAMSIPLIVPRAHDCVTLFLGSSLHGQRSNIVPAENFPQAKPSAGPVKNLEIETKPVLSYTKDVVYLSRDGMDLHLQIISPRGQFGAADENKGFPQYDNRP